MRTLAWIAISAVVAITVAVNLRLVPWLITLVKSIPGRDITGHIVLFGALSLVVNLAFARSKIAGRELGVTGVTSILIVAITLEEWSQRLIPNRDFSLSDLSASFTGAIGCGLIAWIILLVRERELQ